MARPSASSGLCSTSGLTASYIAQTCSDSNSYLAGSTSTIPVGTTPRSAAHPWPPSRTSLGTTPSRLSAHLPPGGYELRALMHVLAVVLPQPAQYVVGAGRIRVLSLAVYDRRLPR